MSTTNTNNPVPGPGELSNEIEENSSSKSSIVKKPRSDIWEHFSEEKVEEPLSKNEVIFLKCKYCHVKYKYSDSDQSTSTPLNHFRKVHMAKVTGEKPAQQNQLKISQIYSPVSAKAAFSQSEYRSHLLRWVVLQNQPFTEITCQPFLDLVKSLSPVAITISNDTIRRDLLQAYNEEFGKVQNILKNISSKISFTQDVWTSKSGYAFFGLRAHFISTDWKQQELSLDFVHLRKRHDGITLCDEFITTLKKFSIPTEKVLSITLDNASNNDTFIESFETETAASSAESDDNRCVFTSSDGRVRCLAHVINLIVQDILSKLKVKSSRKISASVYNLQPVNDDSEDGVERDTLEFSSTDTESTDEEEAAAQPDDEICFVIKKFRILTRKLKKSTVHRENLNKACKFHNIKSLVPITDVVTRWNSTFDAIQRGLELKLPLTTVCLGDRDLKKLCMQENEWIILEKLSKLLQKFTQATKMVCVLKTPTVVLYVPIISWLKKILSDFCNQEKGILKQAALTGLCKLDKYFPSVKNSTIVFIGTILDPSLKLQYFKEHGWDTKSVKQIKDIFVSKYKKHYEQCNVSEMDTDESSSDDFFAHRNKRSRSEKAENEALKYLSDKREKANVDILQFWKNAEISYPNLRRMAKDYLSAPSTSVSLEREFSGGVDVVSPTRTSLKPETIRALMCLKSWWTDEK